MIEGIQKQEEVAEPENLEVLTPTEKELYQKCLEKQPDMTVMTFKELRKKALSSHESGERAFFTIHGVLAEEKPDSDTRRELYGKN